MDWGIIATIVAVILFVISIALTLRLSRKKDPVWAYKTTNIIGLEANAPPELQLAYDGKPVREVYKTTFVVFNKGLEPIRENDVTAPITLSLGGGEILSAAVIRRASNDEIKFSAERVDPNKVQLGFKYLDHDDGAVIELIHTKMEQINCETNIIGTKRMSYKGEFEDILPPTLRTRSIVLLLLGVVGITFIVLNVLGKLNPTGWGMDLSMIVSLFLGAISISILSNYIPQYIRSRKFPSWSRGVTKTTIPTEAVETSKGIPAYCVYCRARKIMKDPKVITMKNGKPATQGNCPDCGTKMFRVGPHHVIPS